VDKNGRKNLTQESPLKTMDNLGNLESKTGYSSFYFSQYKCLFSGLEENKFPLMGYYVPPPV